ncbi:hypothetical protein KCP74_06860 [Salmonella enterica subsp. enterica]|nr:hypothetical protein KCP74_06860 [Salmonella enterica subsp. enterica]
MQDYLTRLAKAIACVCRPRPAADEAKTVSRSGVPRALWASRRLMPESGKANCAIAAEAVSARQDDSGRCRRWGRAYSQQWRSLPAPSRSLKRALAMAHSSAAISGRVLKVNRYWLLIQQGDAALKANNLAGGAFLSAGASVRITPAATRCWGWGCGDGADEMPPPNVNAANAAYG